MQKRANSFTSLAATALIALAGLASGAIQTADADTLKWITFKPKAAGDPQAITTQWFVDEFKKRTGGKHQIEVFWGGSVAKIKEVPDALETGVGDIGDVVTPYFPDKLLLNNVVGVFMPQPKDEIQLAQKLIEWAAEYPQFDEEMKRYNMKVIGWRPLERYGLICTKPIRTAEEFAGKRIRSYGYALPQLIKALGATPVSMATPEAYEALQRGILDCSPIGVTLARGWRYEEVAKYYIDVTLGASWGHLIAMNRNSYEKLDEQTRAILEGLGREYVVEYVKVLHQLTDQILAEWKSSGIEVIPFPDEPIAKAARSEGVQSVRAEWVKKASATGVPAAEMAKFFDF
ncbi:MAG: C4-dicarboxylate TRAP transporter substrate-binding protein [Gammaproteobacteria bacterium]|nr:C4-dicarboxylate TRAP transporter substrate-binding protein [Gammaproteobacteria bacterium]